MEFDKRPVESSRLRDNYGSFWRNPLIIPRSIKKERTMSTSSRLDLERIRSRPIISEIPFRTLDCTCCLVNFFFVEHLCLVGMWVGEDQGTRHRKDT